MQSRQFPIFLLVLIVFIAIVNWMAEVYYWYWRMRWFDMPMHFLGGVWLAWTALWWWYTRRGRVMADFKGIFAVSLVSALGVGLLWEAFQAGLGIETAGHASRLSGTLIDLLFDILGGSFAAVWAWIYSRNKNQS
jgi:hypothetical protein